MKPKHNFEYIADRLYEERKLKQFNKANRNNNPMVSWWTLSAICIGAIIAIVIIISLAAVIDSMPVWFWTVMVLIVVATVVFVRILK